MEQAESYFEIGWHKDGHNLCTRVSFVKEKVILTGQSLKRLDIQKQSRSFQSFNIWEMNTEK